MAQVAFHPETFTVASCEWHQGVYGCRAYLPAESTGLARNQNESSDFAEG